MTLKVIKKQSFAIYTDSILFEIYSQGQGVDFLLDEASILVSAE